MVRVEECEGQVRVRITVTSRLDVHDSETEPTWFSSSIPAAAEHVWEFLSIVDAPDRKSGSRESSRVDTM